MSRAVLVVAFTALHLVACGSKECEIKVEDVVDSVQAPVSADLPPAPVQDDLSQSAETFTSVADAGSSVDGAEIPLQYRGKWTAPLQSCEDVEEYWVYIQANGIRYYETAGTVLAVRQLDASAVEVDLRLQSEGQTWLETQRMRLSDDQQTITGASEPYAARPFTLVRCPQIRESPSAPAAEFP